MFSLLIVFSLQFVPLGKGVGTCVGGLRAENGGTGGLGSYMIFPPLLFLCNEQQISLLGHLSCLTRMPWACNPSADAA